MTAATTPERQLVAVETIRAITPIENADAIESATVRGWNVVVKKGEFQVGQCVLYFEIDSLLPLETRNGHDTDFTFLAPRGEKIVDGRRYHRLKTARMRGVYSQGLVMPLSTSPEIAGVIQEFGIDFYRQWPQDCAGHLDVIKFDEELPEGAAGPFPTTLGQKTSSERAQNLADVWPVIVDGGPWIATEKVDGKSCSVFRDTEGALHVCGRNWEVPAPAGAGQADVYWRAAQKLFGPVETGSDFFGASDSFPATLAPGEGVQFEVYGEGIAKNPLRVKGEHISIFTVLQDGQPVPRGQWPRWALAFAAPIFQIELPATAAEAIEQVDGIKSLINPDRLAEGVVWHQGEGRQMAELGYRSTMKIVSNRYLSKQEG